jgi:hypothetical protein
MPHDVLKALERGPVASEGLSSADPECDPADEALAVLLARVELHDAEDFVRGRGQGGSLANVCSQRLRLGWPNSPPVRGGASRTHLADAGLLCG